MIHQLKTSRIVAPGNEILTVWLTVLRYLMYLYKYLLINCNYIDFKL